MPTGSVRRWLRRGLLGMAVVVLGAGAWAGWNSDSLKTRYATHRFQSAASEEERQQWSERLLAQGERGVTALLAQLQSENPEWCATALNTIERHVNTLPAGDPHSLDICNRVLEAYPACSNPGQRVIRNFVPVILKNGEQAEAVRCRAVIADGLAATEKEDRLLAVRLAMDPRVQMRGDLVPLLNAPEADVRAAVLFAIGPATTDEMVIGDEELFEWLHDPDPAVRKVCYNSLISRGRSDAEISLGRRLTNPDAEERIKFLLILRHDEDVADPEPWLERLSRDPEPGVRAGAVRVAVEVAAERQVPTPPWVNQLAEADPSATVRRVAGYYSALPNRGASGIRKVENRQGNP